MAANTGIKVKFPGEEAEEDELHAFGEKIFEALRELGVHEGDLFEIRRVVTNKTSSPVGENRRGGAYDSKASVEAAKRNEKVNGKQRRQVLQCVVEAGPRGATSTEIKEELPFYPESSIKSRLTELEREYASAFSQGTRPSGNGTPTGVYVATDKGRKEMPLRWNRKNSRRSSQ